MNFETLKATIPDFAKDLRLNLGVIGGASALTPTQAWRVALASALATRDPELTSAVLGEADALLDEAGRRAAGTAASLMGMNNVYYRFVHLTSNPAYGQLPAKLRMQGIAAPGVDKEDFELMALAVSAIHGCGMCLDSHEAVLAKAGVRTEAIQEAVRIAAVLHGIAVARSAGRSLEPQVA